MKKDPISLEASQASITTATVTIKVLQVNSRQLTQSTFRQLPKRNLIDPETLEILGVIWGWVNYTPAGDFPPHTQFVAQFGKELCRCPVWMHKVLPFNNYPPHSGEGEVARMFQRQFFAELRKLPLGRDSPEEATYIAQWNALVDTLRAVEQLYIAT
jgi:hypothetical protein